MSSYGLKTNIAVNTALVLFVGMGIIAFMTTNLVELILMKSHVAKGQMFLSVVTENLTRNQTGPNDLQRDMDFDPISRKLIQDSGVICAVMVFTETDTVMSLGPDCSNQEALVPYARQAALSRKDIETTYGRDWGVFWKQTHSKILAAPIGPRNTQNAGAAVMIPLGPLYSQIRDVQGLVFLYVLINGTLLTLVGVYQISKRVVRPIQRLLERAEDYHGENKNLIFDEKGGNEFNKLSTALNNMLGRISDDRYKLEKTVVSLERTNRELKQAQNDIVRAEKLASVGRLSSGIAHEIGNPLGIVSGYLELIKHPDIDTDQKQDFIRRAESELERIDRIIRQLLDYARTSPPGNTYFSVHEIITDVGDMLRIQPVMSGTALDLNLSAGKDRIKGDADKLKQVLMNLAINAQDAIAMCNDGREGRISIDTETVRDGAENNAENLIRIRVSDNGTGIAEDNLNAVFDPFFTTKDPGKGTGLGLSVCYTIIQDMGGQITVTSEQGRGTTVELTFNLPQPLLKKNL